MFYYEWEVVSIEEKTTPKCTYYIYTLKSNKSKFSQKILSFDDLKLVEGDQAFIPVWLKVNKGKYINTRYWKNWKLQINNKKKTTN